MDPVIELVVKEIVTCFEQYEQYPAIRVGTDSQKLQIKNTYMFSPVIVLHLGNKFNRIFYTTFLRTFRTSPADRFAFAERNVKRLTDEGRITINIARELCRTLQDTSLPVLIPELHFDYNIDEHYASHEAYHAIQSLIQELEFLHEPHYKPHAIGATKAADRIIRKK